MAPLYQQILVAAVSSHDIYDNKCVGTITLVILHLSE